MAACLTPEFRLRLSSFLSDDGNNMRRLLLWLDYRFWSLPMAFHYTWGSVYLVTTLLTDPSGSTTSGYNALRQLRSERLAIHASRRT
jgi:hypothetical protein